MGPFQEPKDPIDIRKDKTKRTTQTLVREFLQTRPGEAENNAYNRACLRWLLVSSTTRTVSEACLNSRAGTTIF